MMNKPSSTVLFIMGVGVIAMALMSGLLCARYVLAVGLVGREHTVLAYTAFGALAFLLAFPGFVFIWMADIANDMASLRAVLDMTARTASRARTGEDRTASVMQSFADRGDTPLQRPDANRQTPARAPAPRPRYASNYDDEAPRDGYAPAPRTPAPRDAGGFAPTLNDPDRVAAGTTSAYGPPSPADDGPSLRPASPPPLPPLPGAPDTLGERAAASPQQPPLSAARTRDTDGKRPDPDVAAIQKNGTRLHRRAPTLRDPAAELDALLREQERRGRLATAGGSDEDRPVRPRIPY